MEQKTQAIVLRGEPGTPGCITSVHTHESSQPDDWLAEVAGEIDEKEAWPVDSAYAKFRHSGWARLRARIRHSLSLAGEPVSRLRSFDACGSHCHLDESKKAGRTRICGNFCKHRFCSPCSNARSAKIKTNVAAFIEGKTTRFLTFTLHQNGSETSHQMLDRIRRSLTLMYRRDEWKTHVHGWATFIEVKRSSRQKQWHLHAHILCEGHYWDQKEISHVWHSCTGDSYIVDIRQVTDAKGGAFYAAKYAAKPCDLGSLETNEQLQEVIRTIGHRKLYTIGGTWKGKLQPLASGEKFDDWITIGFIDDIIHDAEQGLKPAQVIWNHIIRSEQPRPPPQTP